MNTVYFLIGVIFMWCFISSFKNSKNQIIYKIIASLVFGFMYYHVTDLLATVF